MKRKFTEEKARQFERNVPKAQEFLEKSRKSKRIDIMKLRDLMNSRI